MLWEEPGGCPLTGQAVSGMEATRARSAAFVWNRRRRARIPPPLRRGERECPRRPETVRDRVPMPGAPADRPVVAVRLL